MANQTVYPYGTGGSLPSSIGIINDLTTGGVDKALSAQQGVVINEMITYPADYTQVSKETDKQSYGTVGSTISFGALNGMEYVKITGNPTSVKFTTLSGPEPSSYIQYVDDEDTIIALAYTAYAKGTQYTYIVNYPEGATAVYINGAINSIIIDGGEEKTIKEKLEEDTTVLSGGSVSYTLEEAKTSFQYSTYNGYLMKADASSVGSSVSIASSPGSFALRIPLSGLYSVTYPMFKTTGGYGTVAVNSNNTVVWANANYGEADNTLFTVKVEDISTASYLLVGYTSTLTEGVVTVVKANMETIPLNKYILEMPSDNYLGTDEDKVLNLKGASDLYAAILDRLNYSGNAGGMDAFNDFGTMPSCEYGDPGAFLADGLIDSDTTRVMYSDVIAKYDALVTKYPNYVTKTVAGYDASGTIEMYYYTFTPKYWKQSIYLQAGVHGWEPDPVFALAEIMYLVANAYGTDSTTEPYVAGNIPLKFLRGNVKITVFPVVNPWGFNNRGDCSVATKRTVAQNNYDNVQLNGAWGSDEAEAVMVRTLVASLASELSFAIDMHSTVWGDSRTRYGCFYGGVNQNADNVRTIYRTYEWLYQFYNVKYPSIVQGDQCPNIMGNYASVGYMTNTFNSYFYNNYNVEASTMEFSDHVWTEDLHTSIAMSVAVNMYLNQIIQQLNDEYKTNPETGIPSEEMLPAKG